VEEKSVGMYCHKHIVADSTMFYAGHVKKIQYATSKQTQKNVAKTKRSLLLKQACGGTKNALPT
jgi:hypothetical protein